MKPILDPNDPFFRPVWRRWATVIFPLGWSMFELYLGSHVWAGAFGVLGLFTFYMLIIKGPDQPAP
jgi:hypothetical protein